ncbi:RNA-directed DNA polymerase, eukaryota, Reverse transcriptase zinc-binding domain protein [Artemisia annua]|uniref:RNA-directed DNA polymerase, eukaryota, Reverse transcriptase zinc-binding domain protein n=1 Tax=Artemisia annua TaxID=35608 RepID=A0A2U1PSD4_ARTAN|nr:RNA-directed DNA polymerase, eukaryota, Reverse transcriptase zinc-binding domain protein [Artemisia annua]
MIDSYSDNTDSLSESNDPLSRDIEMFTLEFGGEVQQLADEYELRIGKKGYMLDDIWDKCSEVSNKAPEWWYEDGLEKEEEKDSTLKGIPYYPPWVKVDTFEVKRYSFGESGNFICVDEMESMELAIGMINGTRFKGKIQREMDAAERLKINIGKSNLYGIGVSMEDVSNMARALGCAPRSLPFSYLGVTMGANVARRNKWDIVGEANIDQVSSRELGYLSNGFIQGAEWCAIEYGTNEVSVF